MPLTPSDGHLVDSESNETIAGIEGGLPRFVDDNQDYADSFAFQWKTWHSTLSDSRSNYKHAESLRQRCGL